MDITLIVRYIHALLYIMEPICAPGYVLDKEVCKCVTQKVDRKDVGALVKKTRKRCPNGTRRNKKTGLCESNVTGLETTGLKTISKLTTNLVEQGEVTPNTPTQIVQDKLQLSLDKKSSVHRSYSPNINKMLRTLTPSKADNILGCGIEEILVRTPRKITLKGELKVKVGTDKNGKVICARWNSKKARNVMLANLYAYYKRGKELDCNKVIAPMQSLSNCWFNTFFMCYFVSDKGRKFFRFFRELMILGEYADGVEIASSKIKKSLFLLNACIDCSLNPDWWGSVPQLGMMMNTNNVIHSIYNAIPPMPGVDRVPHINEWGNPLTYYQNIVFFLSRNYRDGKMKKFPRVRLDSVDGYNFPKYSEESAPEVIVCNFYDSPPAPNTTKKLLVDVAARNGKKIRYALDSAVIRDIKQTHFTSCLTCSGEQFIFDGASFGQLVPFDWKKHIDNKKSWRFKNSKSAKVYNFSQSYSLCMYYRI